LLSNLLIKLDINDIFLTNSLKNKADGLINRQNLGASKPTGISRIDKIWEQVNQRASTG
jgi:hypothetical protein